VDEQVMFCLLILNIHACPAYCGVNPVKKN
jgi:hypothetical protein